MTGAWRNYCNPRLRRVCSPPGRRGGPLLTERLKKWPRSLSCICMQLADSLMSDEWRSSSRVADKSMAGAGQPWYMPLTWPVGHVVSALSKTAADKPAKPMATSALDVVGHATAAVAACRAFGLAWLCLYGFSFDGSSTVYPAFGAASEWNWSWMGPIILRNVLATWLVCGFWDWFLYFSPWSVQLKPFKFNPDYPPAAQLRHDAFYSTLASVCAAGIEIVLCRGWATGMLPYSQLSDAPVWHLLWVLCITHWPLPLVALCNLSLMSAQAQWGGCE